jgi:HSP20 family protein
MTLRDLVPWRRNEMAREGDPFNALHRELDDLFDRFFGNGDLVPWSGRAWAGAPFSPSVDVDETEKEVRVTAELPGMDEKDVELALAENMLTIKGEKKVEKEEKNGGRQYVERSYGVFQRRVMLPCEVDPAKAKATFAKGILTVTLPKTAKAQNVKKIAISGEK